MRSLRLPLVFAAFGLAACEATMPPAPRAVPEPPPSGKAQLDDADVTRGIAAVQESIDACIDQYRASGTPEAMIEIEPTGRVASAKVYRVVKFSERRCLERAVRATRFPSFAGAPMRVVRTIAATAVTDGGVGRG
jgi:hypothetical protein